MQWIEYAIGVWLKTNWTFLLHFDFFIRSSFLPSFNKEEDEEIKEISFFRLPLYSLSFRIYNSFCRRVFLFSSFFGCDDIIFFCIFPMAFVWSVRIFRFCFLHKLVLTISTSSSSSRIFCRFFFCAFCFCLQIDKTKKEEVCRRMALFMSQCEYLYF